MAILILNSWNSFLDNFEAERKDIYFREEYVNLYATPEEKPTCFCYVKGDCFLLFPYLLRSFSKDGILFYDFETPYGYGGPISNTNDVAFISEGLKAFYSYGKEHNYVAGFIRFHPLLKNSVAFNCIGNVIDDRHTVAIDLNEKIETIWMNEIHTKNRNIIKKGIKNELVFVADYEYRYLNSFIDLYNETMNKLNANNFYYFENSYYNLLEKNIKNGFLGVVLKDGKVLSSAIFFYSENYGHYHLSGSDKSSLGFYPNNFMLWEAAKELKKHGVKSFHLGGGTNSDESNSLLEFKKKFSKSLYSFQIGKVIFNLNIYNTLCAEWEQKYPEKCADYSRYLLKYKF